MNFEKSLTLVPTKKPSMRNPVVERREKMLRKLNRQIELVHLERKGEKISRPWFWTDEQGHIYVHIKYGKHVLELGKGKFSIQCSSMDEVISSLETIIGEVKKGSLDEMLTEVSKDIRTNFGH